MKHGNDGRKGNVQGSQPAMCRITAGHGPSFADDTTKRRCLDRLTAQALAIQADEGSGYFNSIELMNAVAQLDGQEEAEQLEELVRI